MVTLVLRKTAIGLLAFVLVMAFDAGHHEVTWHPTSGVHGFGSIGSGLAQSEAPYVYRERH
jgi:hypothetical protein